MTLHKNVRLLMLLRARFLFELCETFSKIFLKISAWYLIYFILFEGVLSRYLRLDLDRWVMGV